jgi:hypothetical protein
MLNLTVVINCQDGYAQETLPLFLSFRVSDTVLRQMILFINSVFFCIVLLFSVVLR